jgi:hypothetical protein
VLMAFLFPPPPLLQPTSAAATNLSVTAETMSGSDLVLTICDVATPWNRFFSLW